MSKKGQRKLAFFIYYSLKDADKISMNEPMKTIKRDHHLNHLTNVAPFICAVYVIQCYMLSYFFKEAPVSQFAIPLAFGLVFLMGSLVFYDTYHKVDLFHDHLCIKFMGFEQKVSYKEIEQIDVLEPDAGFTSIILHLNKRQKKIIYFADDALEIKNFIEQANQHNSDEQIAA